MNRWLILLGALLSPFMAQASEFPEASDLWLREAPPNARMLAAYVTLNNTTGDALTLTGAYAPDFGMAEIHKTVEVDGVLRMREQERLPLPAASTISMKPGGLHIMLMMPKQTFRVGDQARICLIYQNAAGQELIQHLDFPVLKQ
jgi:copper(I)-binding protein